MRRKLLGQDLQSWRPGSSKEEEAECHILEGLSDTEDANKGRYSSSSTQGREDPSRSAIYEPNQGEGWSSSHGTLGRAPGEFPAEEEARR